MSFLKPLVQPSDEVSRAVQTERDRTDIRAILAKAKRTGGAVAYLNARQALYLDLSSAPDYMGALNVVRRAHEQFEALPSEIRDQFHNSPENFLAFCERPENGDALIKMGLRNPAPVVPKAEPVEVRVINEPPKSS